MLTQLYPEMKTRLLPVILPLIAFACNQGESGREQQTPSTAGSETVSTSRITSIDNSTVLNFLHGKSRGDSAVYDAGKLIESSATDKQTIAKVIAKQVFQRHDSILCLALVKNEFNGHGYQNGWLDGVLLHSKNGTWQKLKEKRHMLWGSSFGFCDCQCQIQPVRVDGENKYLALVRVGNVHQGEYVMYSVVTEGLLAQQNEFMVFESGMSKPCPGFLDLDPRSLKIGVFIKPVDARNDQVQVVSYEERDGNAKCTGRYRTRKFTYAQLLQEVRRPQVVLE